jgi:hypothetical protein
VALTLRAPEHNLFTVAGMQLLHEISIDCMRLHAGQSCMQSCCSYGCTKRDCNVRASSCFSNSSESSYRRDLPTLCTCSSPESKQNSRCLLSMLVRNFGVHSCKGFRAFRPQMRLVAQRVPWSLKYRLDTGCLPTS